jgi:acyl dehydratase
MGKYLEEFVVGEVFVTPGRTITQEDIQAFAELTGDHNPVHVNQEFAAESIFGGTISHGPMMVGITFGLLSRLDLLDGTIIALKALEWSFNAPIRPGEAVHVRATVAEVRASSKAPERGTLSLAIEVVDRSGAIVQVGKVVGIMKSKPT